MNHQPTVRVALVCLLAFFAVWAIRATILYPIDEAIPGGVPRLLYSTGVKFALWVVPALAYARWIRRARPLAYLGAMALPSGRDWGIAFVLTAAYMACITFFETHWGGKHLVLAWPGLVASLFLVASVLIEETLFRGLILREFAERFRGGWANLITSLLFVAIHWPHWLWSRGLNAGVAADSVGVFLVSLLFGALFLRTRSIWPCVVAHVVNNVLAGWLAG